MNNLEINKKQNSEKGLKLLAAMRLLYSRAKSLGAWKLILALLTIIAAPVLLHYYPNSKPFIGALGLIVTFINTVFLKSVIQKNVSEAAQIQEEFDVYVFGLPENKSLVGGKVTSEIVGRLSQKYGDKASLRNWYPETDSISAEKAILISQRSNLVWDWRQRKFFLNWIYVITFFLFLIPIIVALYQNLLYRDYFLQWFLPSLPLIILGIENMLKHHSVVNRQIAKQKEIESLLSQKTIIAPEKLRVIQDAIFQNRKEGAMIPDWVYSLKKDAYEKDMKDSTKEIIAGN